VRRRAESGLKSSIGNKHGELLRMSVVYVAALAAFFAICCHVPALARASSSSVRQTGRISGVRRVLRDTPWCTTRYSRIHDFDVFFALRIGEQTYCGDYETVVLDEINDLASSEGKDVEITLDKSKKRVILYTPQNRKLKARILRASQCSPTALARIDNR
jgi:hypothetical protein